MRLLKSLLPCGTWQLHLAAIGSQASRAQEKWSGPECRKQHELRLQAVTRQFVLQPEKYQRVEALANSNSPAVTRQLNITTSFSSL